MERAEFISRGWGGMEIRTSVRKALCSDGIRRYAKLTAEPDTWFSIPASIKVQGKTVTGFVTSADDGDIYFTANKFGKNGDLLPGWIWKGGEKLPTEKEG